MKLTSFDPSQFQVPLPAPPYETEGQPPGPSPEPPEYVLEFPVPAPEGAGKSVFLTLTPDGRPAAILVDGVRVDERVVRGYLGELDNIVITIPVAAPWMVLRRELLRYTSKAAARQRMADAYRALLGGQSAAVCPVHGAEEGVVEAQGEDRGHGQYL